ncbi:MAG: hypothetical protein AB8F65_10020 [Woeseiaceae bacterium]
MRNSLLIYCLGLLLASSGCAIADESASGDYGLTYDLTLDNAGNVNVILKVNQNAGQLKRLTLRTVDQGLTAFSENLQRQPDGSLLWITPTDGGEISWRGSANQQRQDGSWSAKGGADWAVFRVEDVLPPIASVTTPGADSRTRMHIKAPTGWPIVTAYPGDNGHFSVEDRGRRFDRPDGWILAGNIGVRRDTIAGIRVAIAAPRGQSARRLDAMAFLNWHLPLIDALFDDFPDRFVIAMAGDPFFRGGLSAPNSLFLHTDRPLVSGNGTSTLLHELFHAGLSRSAADGADWIVEGLAEFYSQQWLFEAGSVTERRHLATLTTLRQWGRPTTTLKASRSAGATTARAVTVFATLDQEIRQSSKQRKTLDDVVRILDLSEDPLTLNVLRDAASEVLGQPARTLQSGELPGYD